MLSSASPTVVKQPSSASSPLSAASAASIWSRVRKVDVRMPFACRTASRHARLRAGDFRPARRRQTTREDDGRCVREHLDGTALDRLAGPEERVARSIAFREALVPHPHPVVEGTLGRLGRRGVGVDADAKQFPLRET